MIQMTQDTFVSTYDRIRRVVSEHAALCLPNQLVPHDVFILEPSKGKFLCFVVWHGNDDDGALIQVEDSIKEGETWPNISMSYRDNDVTYNTYWRDMVYRIENLRKIWINLTTKGGNRVITPIPSLKDPT